jgi:hypothetical protein
MKLFLLPAILLGLNAAPEVRYEAAGVRVGAELVTGAEIALKEAGARPILVSKTVVESLGAPLAVDLGGRTALLEPGVRLARAGEGFVLSTHGPSLAIAAGEKTLRFEKSASFKVTETGFDFGAAGTLEAAALTAKTDLAAAVQIAPRQGENLSPARTQAEQARRAAQRRRLFADGDPTAQTGPALDREVLQTLAGMSPF